MAALPGGWSSPFFVTRPTPSPPSISTPSPPDSRTVAYISAPCVASMSSPPSFLTAHVQSASDIEASSTGRTRRTPLGVEISIEPRGSRESSMRVAALEAAAAHVPVVCPVLRRLLFFRTYLPPFVASCSLM